MALRSTNDKNVLVDITHPLPPTLCVLPWTILTKSIPLTTSSQNTLCLSKWNSLPVTKGRSLVCPPYRQQHRDLIHLFSLGNDHLIAHSDEVVLCLKGLAQPHNAFTRHSNQVHSYLIIWLHLLRALDRHHLLHSSSRVQSSFTETWVSWSQQFAGLL